MQMTATIVTRIALAAAFVATAVLGVGSTWAAEIEVNIAQFAFAPQRLTVKVGTTVIWINGDDAPHTVASTSKSFRSKTLDTLDKFSFTFTTPGSYEYFCSLHPHMTGSVVVEAATTGSGETP